MLMTAGFFVTVGALVVGKAFEPATLRRGPERDVGLNGIDVLVAVGAFLMGIVLQSMVMVAWLGVTSDGGDLSEAFDALSGTELALFSIAGQLVTWGPGIVYLLFRLSMNGNLRLGGVIPRRPARDLGVAAVGTWVAFILSWALGVVITLIVHAAGGELPEHGHTALAEMAAADSWVVIALLAVAAVVIAPILEEFFFRGLLQTALQSVIGHEKRWMSILPVAVFFGVIHFGSVPWFMLPVLVLLGVIFGWVYERTGSLWCAVGVHAGYNATSVVLSLLMQ